MAENPDSELIRRAKGGSHDALDQVLERYGPRLLALVRLRLGPSLRAQLESRDIVQQTMLKAFQHIDQFDGAGKGSMLGWLAAIAQNEIRDHAGFYRRQVRDAALNVPLEEAAEKLETRLRTEVSRIELGRQIQLLERALDELGEARREVILLRRYEELTYPEIGKRLGKSPDACRVLHARAMAELAVRMKELAEWPDREDTS